MASNRSEPRRRRWGSGRGCEPGARPIPGVDRPRVGGCGGIGNSGRADPIRGGGGSLGARRRITTMLSLIWFRRVDFPLMALSTVSTSNRAASTRRSCNPEAFVKAIVGLIIASTPDRGSTHRSARAANSGAIEFLSTKPSSSLSTATSCDSSSSTRPRRESWVGSANLSPMLERLVNGGFMIAMRAPVADAAALPTSGSPRAFGAPRFICSAVPYVAPTRNCRSWCGTTAASARNSSVPAAFGTTASPVGP